MERNENSSNLIDTLAESLSERVEQKRKAAQPVPEIYSSGMRGTEKPPSQRQAKKDDKADKGKPGKKKVEFEATPKKKSSEIIAELQARLDKLEKGQPKKKIKIA